MTKKAKAAQQAEQQTQTNGDTAGTNQDAQGAAQTTEGGQTPTEQQQTDPTASGTDQTGEANLTPESQDPQDDARSDDTGLDDDVKNPTDLTTAELNVLNHVADQLAQPDEDKVEPHAYSGAAPATPYEAVPSHEHHLLNLVDATLGFPPEEAYEQLKVMDITEWSKPCRDYHAAIMQYVDEQE